MPVEHRDCLVHSSAKHAKKAKAEPAQMRPAALGFKTIEGDNHSAIRQKSSRLELPIAKFTFHFHNQLLDRKKCSSSILPLPLSLVDTVEKQPSQLKSPPPPTGQSWFTALS